ncbi:hypothetical protein MAR_028806, partial [Mya arenaria]
MLQVEHSTWVSEEGNICYFKCKPKYKGDKFILFKVFTYAHAGTRDWRHYKAVFYRTRQFIEPFNSYLGTTKARPKVEFLAPEVAIMDTQSDFQMFARFFWNFNKTFSEDEAVVIERRLKGDFITYIDTTGYATHEMSALPAAFCHFSYQESG